eukprot:12701955-Alexandrium_andersonii.AAC.1
MRWRRGCPAACRKPPRPATCGNRGRPRARPAHESAAARPRRSARRRGDAPASVVVATTPPRQCHRWSARQQPRRPAPLPVPDPAL